MVVFLGIAGVRSTYRTRPNIASGSSMGRVIAIGDIHGCAAALRAVLAEVQPTADDILVPLGDYVDRGPDSRGVIETLLELETTCQLRPLKGNHEIMLLEAVARPDIAGPWLDCGGEATVASYGGELAAIPPEHLALIRRCRPYFETATHLFFHANYQFDLTPAEQPDFILYWEHLHYRQPRPHDSGKIVVVGHSSQRSGEILDLGHVVCIDTYCHGGGWLTALDVLSGTIWQADRAGNRRIPLGPVRPFPPGISDV
ncbi:MAG: metallophosphoesterase family protein [Pirellulaceae bacterium]|nr:metallophosphoesterase family protein [Pirellulaceae bacterium]